MTQDPFQLLKDTCNTACHERRACANGYRQMLQSQNVSQMMATWRDNWEDVTESKYSDIIRTELPKQYDGLKEEMNAAGIYMNECPEGAKRFVKVIVTKSDTPVHIYGEANAYILDSAKVVAHDHAHVYNIKAKHSKVELLDYAYGNVRCGSLIARCRSRVVSSGSAKVTLDGSVDCEANGGSVTAISYRRIDASVDAIVYAHNGHCIYLAEDASIKPLNSENNE